MNHSICQNTFGFPSNRWAILAFTCIFAITMLLSSCGGNDECPLIQQPEVKEFSQWERQRFPYRHKNELTFRIEKKGQIDTITLFRTKFDSTVITSGDDINTDNGCPQAFNDRWRVYYALYEDQSGAHKLKFTMEQFTESIGAQWGTDSTTIWQRNLNRFLGPRNSQLPEDSVEVLSKYYTPGFCGYGTTWKSDSVQVCFSYHEGFILIHDIINQKKWEYLGAQN